MTQSLRRFLSLSTAAQRLLFSTTVLVGAIRICLWLLPFQTVRRALARMERSTHRPPISDRVSTDEIIWAVNAASRFLPSITCLAQALAAQTLLGRQGCHVDLRIGVARGVQGRLDAHAWLESGGRVVIGERNDLNRFSLLSPSSQSKT
jgi:hypothetical protein